MKILPKTNIFRGLGRLLRALNIFHSWRITTKLITTVVLLLVGFGAIAWAYWTLAQVEASADERAKRQTQFVLTFESTRAALQEALSQARLFLRDPDEETWSKFGRAITKANSLSSELEKIESSERQQGLMYQLRSRISSFQREAVGLDTVQRTIGIDENGGLRGRLRDLAHELEGLVAGNPELGYWLLQMRRDEKDYINRRGDKYVNRMAQSTAGFMTALAKEEQGLRTRATPLIDQYVDTFTRLGDTYTLRAQQIGLLDKEEALLEPLIHSAIKIRDQDVAANDRQREAESVKVNRVFVSVLAAIGILVTLSLILLSLGMTRSLRRLRSTVQQVTEGNLQARCALPGGDELAQLGKAFDTMLEERVATLSEVERERDMLNDSIIALMGAVAQLSQKDLTVKAVVAEDITGPVADAVNLMADETSKVLSRIREVSQQVEQAANTVRAQAEKVTEVAAQERHLVQESAEELRHAGVTMTQLAKDAKGADQLAAVAMDHTQSARAAVSSTVGGIEQIREIIRETEKRIKRLGERSQEITGAVNLINTIAERTHILALNASMHAASAGEAGRGFVVVADEVQRLAESSREATSDIASMVSAIRVETADAVDTMNRVIAQVAEGSRMAQDAGQKMQDTESTTAQLVAAVQQIATGAEQQARRALGLMKRSQVILQSTEQTSTELKEQSAHTVSLVDYSNTLRESVSVFKLPAAA